MYQGLLFYSDRSQGEDVFERWGRGQYDFQIGVYEHYVLDQKKEINQWNRPPTFLSMAALWCLFSVKLLTNLSSYTKYTFHMD